jgi:hypothetical protein
MKIKKTNRTLNRPGETDIQRMRRLAKRPGETEKDRAKRLAKENWDYHRSINSPSYLKKLANRNLTRVYINKRPVPKHRTQAEEQRLIDEVSAKYGVGDITGVASKKAMARAEVAYRMLTEFGYSYRMIAVALNRIQRSGEPDHERAVYWVGTHILRQSGEWPLRCPKVEFFKQKKHRVAMIRAAAKTVSRVDRNGIRSDDIISSAVPAVQLGRGAVGPGCDSEEQRPSARDSDRHRLVDVL